MNPKERNIGFYGHGTPQLMVVFHPKYPFAASVYPDTFSRIPRRYKVDMPEGGLKWCAVTYGMSEGWKCIMMDARRPEDWGDPDSPDRCPDPEVREYLEKRLGPQKNRILIRGVTATAQFAELKGFQRYN